MSTRCLDRTLEQRLEHGRFSFQPAHLVGAAHSLIFGRCRGALSDLGPNDVNHLLCRQLASSDLSSSNTQPDAWSVWTVDSLGVVDCAHGRSNRRNSDTVTRMHRGFQRLCESLAKPKRIRGHRPKVARLAYELVTVQGHAGSLADFRNLD
jgi:hypothetical protein